MISLPDTRSISSLMHRRTLIGNGFEVLGRGRSFENNPFIAFRNIMSKNLSGEHKPTTMNWRVAVLSFHKRTLRKLANIEILVKIDNTADRSGFGKYCKSKMTPS